MNEEEYKEQLKKDIKYLEDLSSKLLEVSHYYTGIKTENDGAEHACLNAIDKATEARAWFEEALLILRQNLEGICGH